MDRIIHIYTTIELGLSQWTVPVWNLFCAHMHITPTIYTQSSIKLSNTRYFHPKTNENIVWVEIYYIIFLVCRFILYLSHTKDKTNYFNLYFLLKIIVLNWKFNKNFRNFFWKTHRTFNGYIAQVKKCTSFWWFYNS